MNTSINTQIAALDTLAAKQLRDRYLELFGEPSRSGNVAFLRKRIAWRIQSLAEGTLSERARKRAAEIVRDADIRVRMPRPTAPSDGATVTVKSDVRYAGRPTLGTILTRQYRTPIDWVLLCDEPVTSRDDAIRLSGWYARRWLIEEYHKCLKTGCRVEDRQLEHADRLSPLIGMLCVLATRLLTLKTNARVTPDAPAIRHVPRQSVDTLARMLKCDASRMTLRTFTHEVAKLGGFIGRRSDGNPGFQTLWHGLQQLDLISYGIRLGRCG